MAVLLFCVKLVAFFITHSVAILTDALEGTVNLAAGFIGLYSLYIASQPSDKNHPYGHGKAEFISAAIEGTLITVAGVLIITMIFSYAFPFLLPITRTAIVLFFIICLADIVTLFNK